MQNKMQTLSRTRVIGTDGKIKSGINDRIIVPKVTKVFKKLSDLSSNYVTLRYYLWLFKINCIGWHYVILNLHCGYRTAE